MFACSIQHATKRYGSTIAVDDLSLHVPEGSIYGLIGPNGSGKTTTLRMIVNILYPDRGRVEVLGERYRGSRLADVGYLPEERGLYRKMRVVDHLRFVAALRSSSYDPGDVTRWLERLDLASHASRRIETLSKGMTQKVQFIAAVVPRPALAVLDEPFNGLDPVNVEVIRSALLRLRDDGTTIILSTHDMNLAESLCDYICMVHRGQKVLDGTLHDIRALYGQDTVRLRVENGQTALQELPGVASVHNLGGMHELHLEEGADPGEILALLVERTRVLRFEVAHPSLHDIFVRIASPGAKEPPHA